MDANKRDAVGWVCGTVIAVGLFTSVCVGVVVTSAHNVEKRRAALEVCTGPELPVDDRVDCVEIVVDGIPGRNR